MVVCTDSHSTESLPDVYIIYRYHIGLMLRQEKGYYLYSIYIYGQLNSQTGTHRCVAMDTDSALY